MYCLISSIRILTERHVWIPLASLTVLELCSGCARTGGEQVKEPFVFPFHHSGQEMVLIWLKSRCDGSEGGGYLRLGLIGMKAVCLGGTAILSFAKPLCRVGLNFKGMAGLPLPTAFPSCLLLV